MLPPRFEKHTAVSYKQRNMVMQGTFFSSHKRLRTIVLAAKILIFPFTKGTSAITIDLQKDNKTYLVKMGEGGGTYNKQLLDYRQTNLEIPIGQSHHDYCRIPPEQAEYERRLGFSPWREQFRMEAFG